MTRAREIARLIGSGPVDGSVNVTGTVRATGGFNVGIQSSGLNITTAEITAINFLGAGSTFRYNTQNKVVDVSVASNATSSSTTTPFGSVLIFGR